MRYSSDRITRIETQGTRMRVLNGKSRCESKSHAQNEISKQCVAKHRFVKFQSCSMYFTISSTNWTRVSFSFFTRSIDESKGKDRISRYSQCHCPSDYSAFDTYRDNIPSSSVYSLRPRRSTWMEYYPPARAEARRLIGIGDDGRVTGFGSRSRVKFRFIHFSPRFFAAHAADYRLSSSLMHHSFALTSAVPIRVIAPGEWESKELVR